jgi:alpha-beta hydrolase superfamily lysophospholipase
VDAGIAVLSYDKRGVGSSSGDWLDSTLDDLAADATAALGFLYAQPEVRAGPAGLLGHGEGAGSPCAPPPAGTTCPG